MRLLVNDCLTCIPGTRTFWHDLRDWFGMTFIGGEFGQLDGLVSAFPMQPSLIVRNSSYFGPLASSEHVPTISLVQDIHPDGPMEQMQHQVKVSSAVVVYNSEFTAEHSSDAGGSLYEGSTLTMAADDKIIPLPVDFDLFKPDGSDKLYDVCWIGASQGAAGHVKGWDIFTDIVVSNPDLSFVAVLKDAAPADTPSNLTTFVRLTHKQLVPIINLCRIGLCTSRSETQHLAGIEMGACGLPIVAPHVGCYWLGTGKHDVPGVIIEDLMPEMYSAAIGAVLASPYQMSDVRSYWQSRYDKPIIRQKWADLIDRVERS